MRFGIRRGMRTAVTLAIGTVVVLVGACSSGDAIVEQLVVDGRVVSVTVEEGVVTGEFPATLVFPDSRPLRTVTARPDDAAPLEGIPLLSLTLQTDVSASEVMAWYRGLFEGARERFEATTAPEMRYFRWGRFSGSLIVAVNGLDGGRSRVILIDLYDPPTFPPVSRLTEVLLGVPGWIEGPDGQVFIPEPGQTLDGS